MWLSPEISRYSMYSPLALPPELRIPRIPESITEQVEAEHRQADGEPGKDREPRRLLHERPARARQHQPPRRCRRLGADAEERERRLDQDRVAEPDRRDHEDRRRDVRQDVGRDDAWMATAERLRRLDIPVLFRREHRAANDARVAGDDHD